MAKEPNKPMDVDTRQAADQAAGTQPAGDGAQASAGQEGEQADQPLDSLRQELDSMKGKYLRALADCQNIQKRTAAERTEAVQRGQADMSKALLPVLDNFERTLEAAKDAKDATTLTRGVQIIYEQMLKVLGEFGMQRMDVAKGDPFDPEYQQAVAQQPTGEVEPEHVLHVAQAGYTMRDRILRPATVVVAKPLQNDQE